MHFPADVAARRFRAFADTRVGAAVVIEAIVVVAVTAALLVQLLSYPTTTDPDPDGYVSYANHLLATGELPRSRRLPGYPVFLAAATLLFPGTLHEAVYWAQLWLMVAACLGVWAFARWRFGPLPAILFLGMVAAPSYLSRMSVLMLPDVPYSLLMLPFLLGVGWWTLAIRPPGRWWWLVILGLALFALHATRPTTFALLALYLPSLIVGLLVQRWIGDASRLTSLRNALIRTGALLAIGMVVLVLNDRLLDTGARAYNAELIAYRVVTQLPPASGSAAEKRIEEAKRRFRRIEGQPIEEARFGTYEKFAMYTEFRQADVMEVWRDRLYAHPVEYLGVVWQEIRLGHYMLARHVVPYFMDLTRFSLFSARYPRDDGTPEGNMFRQYGLVVLDRKAGPAHYPLETDTTAAILQLIAAWGLLGLGVWRAAARYAAQTLALILLFVGFVVAVAATNTLDARYLLPFIVPIYLGQALGIAWIATVLSRQTPALRPTPNAPN